MYIDVKRLKANMRYHDISQGNLAEELGICRDTFIRRMKRGDFTIKQIHKMMAAIPLSMDEMEQIFFAKTE